MERLEFFEKMSAPKAVGVTTWIKKTLMKGVPFDRRGCTGMGDPTKGASLGRKVDAGFKTLCKTGSMPRGCSHWVLKRLTAIEKTLKQAGVRLVDANRFVKVGHLKTHIDGIGRMSNGAVVVIELKCTQASLANHRAAYDVACSTLPKIKLGGDTAPNSERIHHQIQVAFGVFALKGAQHGLVVVSASDGAVAYRATSGIPATVFSKALPVRVLEAPQLKPKKRRAPSKPDAVKGYRWPGSRVVFRGGEWDDASRVTLCVAMVRHKHGGELGLVTATFSGQKNFMAAKKRLATAERLVEDPVHKRMIVVPIKGVWKCYCV